MGFGISGFERRGLSVEQGIEAGPTLYKSELDREKDENLMHSEVKGRMIAYTYVRWVRAYLGLILDNGWVPLPNGSAETLDMVKGDVVISFHDFKIYKENYGKPFKALGVFNDVRVTNVLTGKRIGLRLEAGAYGEAEVAANAINTAAGVAVDDAQ